MKKPNEIKKGLEYCTTTGNCTHCPYRDDCDSNTECGIGKWNGEPAMRDALSYIQLLEDGIDRCYKIAKDINVPSWIAPKDKMPDVPVFIGISKFNPDAQIYRKNPTDPNYTAAWLNIRNDILWWMPVPEVAKDG